MGTRSGKQLTESIRKIGPLSRLASFRAESLNEDQRTIEVIWTTGERVSRWGIYQEELSLDPGAVRMGRITSGRAPFLDCHSGWSTSSVVGVVVSASIDGGEGRALIRFVKGDADADLIWNKIRQGILCNVSVGYVVHRFEQIEGGIDTVPVIRAVDWEPYEISIVPMGADSAAAVRSAAGGLPGEYPCTFALRAAARPEGKHMKPKLRQDKGSAKPAKRSEGDAEGKSEGEAQEKREPCSCDPEADNYDEACDCPDGETEGTMSVEKAGEEERSAGGNPAKDADKEAAKRHASILRRVEAAGLSRGVASKLAAELIASGAGDREISARIDAALSEKDMNDHGTRRGHGIQAGEDDSEKFVRGAANGLIQRAGLAPLVERHRRSKGDNTPVTADGLGGMRALRLAEYCVQRSGVETRGLSDDKIANLALRGGSGSTTTSQLPVAMEVALHAVKDAAYALMPVTWREFAVVKSLTDFRPHDFHRPGTFGRLDRVNEAGEFERRNIPDTEKQTLRLGTRGNIVVIDRRVLIDDQLGVALDDVKAFGEAMALGVDLDVWDLLELASGTGPLLSDGKRLFHTDHKNISTGAAISAAKLELDAVKLAEQTDHTGNVLDLKTDILIVPRGLRGIAEGINRAPFNPDTGAALQEVNIAQGLFRLIIASARLTASTTRRWILASPSLAPVYAVGFREGNDSPQMDMEEDFKTGGLAWRLFLDYAVGVLGFRGAVMNAGT